MARPPEDSVPESGHGLRVPGVAAAPSASHDGLVVRMVVTHHVETLDEKNRERVSG